MAARVRYDLWGRRGRYDLWIEGYDVISGDGGNDYIDGGADGDTISAIAAMTI